MCARAAPYCAEMMMGIKVCSRETEGGMWRLLWVSRYSCMSTTCPHEAC